MEVYIEESYIGGQEDRPFFIRPVKKSKGNFLRLHAEGLSGKPYPTEQAAREAAESKKHKIVREGSI